MLCSNFTELRVAVLAWRCGIGHDKIVNHPTFVPTALVCDYEQRRDVREDVQKCFRIIWVGGQPWFELEYHADGSECRQAAVAPRGAELHGVVDPGKNLSKHVRFKAARIQQIILN